MSMKHQEYPFDRVDGALRHCLGQLNSIHFPEHEHHISAAHLDQVASTARETRDHFSESLTNIMRIFYNLAPERSPEQRQYDGEISSVLYGSHIGIHVLLNQHLHTWEMANSQQSKEYNPEEEELISIDPNIVTKHNILRIVEASISDSKALCTEKLGEIPDFQIVHPEAAHWSTSSLCVSSHLHFILVELLKNAAKATFENTMKDFDSMEVDTLPTLPPVKISASVAGSYWSLKISDSGGGMEYDGEKNCMQWYRSATKTKTPTYTYGGDFGPQLSGLGVGLPTSRLYCRFMGGDLRLLTQYGAGTDVVVHWNRFGTSEMPNC